MDRNAHFELEKIQGLIAVTEAATLFRPTWGQEGKIPPGLWLVGDRGIYLMSNRQLPETQTETTVAGPIVYAIETNPDKGDDWLDEKRRIFGGDDGCEFLDLSIAKAWMAQHPKKKYLKIAFKNESLSFNLKQKL